MRWPTSATRAPPSSTPRATRGRSSCGARIATATLSSGCPRAPQRSPKLARKKYLRLHAVEVERAIDERAAVLARGYGVPLSNVRGHAEREVQTEWPMPDTWPWLVCGDADSESATAPTSPASADGEMGVQRA